MFVCAHFHTTNRNAMKFFCLLIITIFVCAIGVAQTFTVTGNIFNEKNNPLRSADILVSSKKDTTEFKTETAKDGGFSISVPSGSYYLSVAAHGYEGYSDSFIIGSAPLAAGVIHLIPVTYLLDEVKIVQKVLAMVQRDDTVEFNSGAYKVNPDADAADLVKKMPSIEISDKQIKAQGENVTKVLVDGKPFFGSDPFAALKNLPADVIDKVQVYNEKSDQEQFTGFSEGAASKTINVITKPGKKKGFFGKVYAGYGPSAIPGSSADVGDKYGVGTTLNQFSGDRRITITEQSNNVNAQNFTSDNSGVGGGGGLATTNATGINYSEKWGKKTDISASYFFNETNSSIERQLRKTYILSVDSGQVYNESNPVTSHNDNHRFNLRFNYAIDSMNSVLWQPAISVNNSKNNTGQQGNTTEAMMPVNQVSNRNIGQTTSFNLSGGLLFRHKFYKKGRTFSLNANTNNSTNNGKTIHTAEDIYFTGAISNDTINQQILQKQNTWNLSGNATYTEPAGNHGLVKLEYTMGYQPARSDKNASRYSYTTDSYSIPDIVLSNSFRSSNLSHKAGGSYLYRMGKGEFSVGVNYQLTELRTDQAAPVSYNFSQNFENILPTATLHYKFSKTHNLQITYNTGTQVPSVTQLQNVITDADPLHLYAGNPLLKQPYQHTLTIRYTGMGSKTKNNISASVTGAVTQHAITSNSIIAERDTLIAQSIVLHRGSQLTTPQNIDGNQTLSANVSYGVPLGFLKCHLNAAANATLSRIPAVVNNEVNYQDNKNTGITISVSSNISENIDFTVSSASSRVSNSNAINRQLNTNYFNESGKASLNLIMWKGIVFNTALAYQANAGLAAGYNKDYLLWNVSLGKKIFKKRQGDIRLSAFDMLNQNNNIQHTVTDLYIQDSRSNTLQRYFLLVFTYKISEFRK
jgi:hypothetical protein